MNKNELLKRIASLEEEIEEVREKINNGEYNKNFIPEYRKFYFNFNRYGLPCEDAYTEDYLDKVKFVIGNCFRTEEDAENSNFLEYVDALYTVKKYIKENWYYIPDWNNHNQNNYQIIFDNGEKNFDYDWSNYYSSYSILPFLPSKEACDDVIANFSKELKTILNYNRQ